jgi:hypothetical protein
MSHYAKVVNGKVTDVIVADADFFKTFVDITPGTWLKTSYNTHGNQNANGNPLRGNYAGIGYTYDVQNDVFYEPQPFPSWALDANWLWQPPVAMPTDGNAYMWDETTKNWVEQNV